MKRKVLREVFNCERERREGERGRKGGERERERETGLDRVMYN